jgi:hypothetical protein
LKLAPLLAQYLYQQQTLHLAGIGSFSIGGAQLNTDSKTSPDSISFENNSYVKEDESLVSYISSQTGKMKALASSDLNSYLGLAKEFLNIGKPFQIEGIGTLVKKGSRFEFTPENMLSDKTRESGMKELSATSTSDESFTTYENLKPHTERDGPYKKIFVGLLVVATTAIVVWGGYKLYKATSGHRGSEPVSQLDQTSPVISPPKDTTAHVVNKPQNSADPNSFRFVIETAGRQRAFQRYTQLKEFSKVQISTADSVSYKLFFVLHATPADTARIRDSLHVVYPAINKKKGYVEVNE